MVKLIHMYHKSEVKPPAATGLMTYIVAKSWPKMLQRIGHSVYSGPLIARLVSIKNFAFVPQVPNLARPDVGDQRRDYDNEFLTLVPLIASRCGLRVDSLRSITSTSPLIYTAETCHEFHDVLCGVILGFVASLKKLRGTCQKGRKLRSPPSKSDLQDRIDEVRFYGLSLQVIAYTSIIDDHLSTIAGFLGPPGTFHNPSTTYPIGEDPDSLDQEAERREGAEAGIQQPEGQQGQKQQEEQQQEEEEEEEDMEEDMEEDIEDMEDEELAGVQPNSDSPRSKLLPGPLAYRAWIRLMVAYFDSFRLVIKEFPSRLLPEISIKVVAVPYQGRKMACWRDVVTELSQSQSLPIPLAASEVFNAIDELRAGNKLDKTDYFKTHFGEQAPLSTGQQFSGTLHCEACIASLIYVSKNSGGAIDDTLSHLFTVSCFIFTSVSF